MRSHLGLLVICLFTSCSVISEQHTSLAGESAAIYLGPMDANLARPQFFIANAVEDAALAELVPYHSIELVLHGNRSAQSATHEAIERLMTNRPDAILAFPNPAKVTGVNNTVFFTPFTGMMSFASAATATPVVAYALRAARCRLPFQNDLSTGFVRDIYDRTAAPGLLEGDTITMLGSANAQPPKEWPTWDFYATWLSLRPGDALDIHWIRPGKGKMQGTVTMLSPLSPHIGIVDSIDCEWVPQITTTKHQDGRNTWSIGRNWGPPHQDR
jgi:hypothetical protein